LKIALVIYSLEFGGAERVAVLLSKAFKKKGHDVTIITNIDKIQYDVDVKIINLNLPYISNHRIFSYIQLFRKTLLLRKIYKKMNFDSIFSFMENSNIPSLLVNRKTNISIHTSHTYNEKKTLFLAKYFYRYAKNFIVVSEDSYQYFKYKHNIKNVKRIYNPIDFLLIKKKLKNSKINPCDFKYVLAVGRFVEEKGFDLLIKAYAKTKLRKFAKLVILGSGKLEDDLKMLISELNLNGNVVLPGFCDNPFIYYKYAEFFISSSRREGFPMTLIEALACGCAVISSDCKTGPNEIIKDNQNGLLIPVENIDYMSRKMDLLYFDETLKNKFRLNAHNSIKKFNIEYILDDYMKLI